MSHGHNLGAPWAPVRCPWGAHSHRALGRANPAGQPRRTNPRGPALGTSRMGPRAHTSACALCSRPRHWPTPAKWRQGLRDDYPLQWWQLSLRLLRVQGRCKAPPCKLQTWLALGDAPPIAAIFLGGAVGCSAARREPSDASEQRWYPPSHKREKVPPGARTYRHFHYTWNIKLLLT